MIRPDRGVDILRDVFQLISYFPPRDNVRDDHDRPLMPTYFYHLSIELRPRPETVTDHRDHPVFLPPLGSDIFKVRLPSHRPSSDTGRRSVESASCTSKESTVKSKDNHVPISGQESRSRRPVIGAPNGASSGSASLFTSQEERLSPSRPGRLTLHDHTLDDGRLDLISLESIDMSLVERRADDRPSDRSNNDLSNGLGAGPAGFAAKGKYVPLDSKNTELGWGIVHLYRDAEETPGLYDDTGDAPSTVGADSTPSRSMSDVDLKTDEEQCTTLCILAVPSYLTPSDFLGFVGEKTREIVSHFRMIRTGRTNRYMVLMKFRSPKKAKQWRKDWNGRAFVSTEVCTSLVTLVKAQ